MFIQAEILADMIRDERELALSPAQLERRRLARAFESVGCCTGPSLAARLRSVLDRRATTCCAAA
jgi:hypothetical protein